MKFGPRMEERNRKWTKLQKTETKVIDNEVLNWFWRVQKNNLPISGLMPQEKSKQIAELHRLAGFKCYKMLWYMK